MTPNSVRPCNLSSFPWGLLLFLLFCLVLVEIAGVPADDMGPQEDKQNPNMC
jgi:hypothetical protein